MRHRRLVCVVVALLTLAAAAQTTDEQATDDLQILLIGNSHSSKNNLPGLIEKLVEAGHPGSSPHARTAPGWSYLADRLDDKRTLGTFHKRPWTHVILQAQKYSTSGRYFYPTDAAEEWIRLHAADGNHSSPLGALLTAYVLYQSVTGDPASELPYIEKLKADVQTQKILRDAASSSHATTLSCSAIAGS